MNDLPFSVHQATPLLDGSRRAAVQVRTAIQSRAVLWFLTSSTLTIIGLLVFDYLLQREDRALRWLWLGIAIFAISIPLVRLVIPSLRFRCGPIELASWLERQKPDTSQGITTVLELAETAATDLRFGSVGFREAALAEQLTRTNLRALDQVVNWSPVMHAGTAFTAAILAGLLFISGWPDASLQAFRRLLMPWSTETWPTRDQLEFKDLPTNIGFGTSLRLEIVDRKPPLPSDVQVEIRDADDRSFSRQIPVEIDSGIAIATLPALLSNADIRATGGDDRSMEWRTINVVAFPLWTSFRFEITLPDYLRSSPEAKKLLASDFSQTSGTYWLTGQTIEIPAGSKVRFLGELDRPLVSVKAIPDPFFRSPIDSLGTLEAALQPPTIASESTSPNKDSDDRLTWHSTVGGDGKQIVLSNPQALPLVINRSLAWNFLFEMENDCVLTSPGKWKIDVIQDQPPEINLELPPISSITVNSPLPLIATIHDDWELREITAKIALESDRGAILEMSLPISEPISDISLDTLWSFSGQLKKNGIQLRPEETLVFWIEAVDSSGQAISSQIQNWKIESPNRQLEILAQSQSGIAEQLEQTLELQRTSQTLTQELFVQLSNHPVQQPQIDTTTGIVQLQRTISNQLTDSQESILNQLEQIVKLLQQNGLAESDLHKRMVELRNSVTQESSKDIETALTIAQEFRELLQLMGEQNDSSSDWQQEWAKLNDSQSKAYESIESLVENLNSNQSADRMAFELQSMASQQRQLLSATNQLQLDRLQQGDEVPPEPIAELSNQQLDLARQMEHWLRRAQELQSKNPNSLSPESKSVLNQVSELLFQSQVAPKMRDASQSMRSEQLGGAIELQTSVDQNLRRALEHLELEEHAEIGTESSLGIDSRTQQLRMLRESLENFILRQQELIPLYLRLSELQQIPDASHELQTLSTIQVENHESLREELLAIRSELDLLPLFQWSLEIPCSDMSRAVAMAKRKRFAPDAVSSSQDALNQMTAILRSLENSNTQPDSSPAGDQSDSESGNSTSDDSNQAAIPLASLRLIRCLQEELAHQTQTLDEQNLGFQRNARRSELALRQTQLAEKMRGLMDEMRAQVDANTSSTTPKPENRP